MRAGAGLAIGLLLLVGGCRSADPQFYPARPGDVAAEAIVLDNHWHTALIFVREDLPLALRTDLESAAGYKYVAIGWGDEGFFRAEKITAGLIAQALFYSRGSVLLVMGFDTEPEETFAEGIDIYRVPTRPASVAKIIDGVAATFRREGGHVIDAGPGIDGGRFYAARGRYAFYHTCNQFTADRLADGGMPITAAYAATAGNVAVQLRQLSVIMINGRPPLQHQASRPLLARGR